MKIIRPVPVTETATFTRASTALYVDSNGTLQLAGVNVPRYTYDPVNLNKPPTLLYERASTNITPSSNSLLSGSGWSTNGGTQTNGGYPDPAGGNNASLWTQSVWGQGKFYAYVPATPNKPVIGSTYTFSFYCKQVSGVTSLFWGAYTPNPSNTQYASFDFSTGQFDFTYLNTMNVEQYGSAAAGGGWYRVWMKFTVLSETVSLILYNSVSTADSQVYIYGAQVEEGSITSYINTSAAPVTRAADALSVGGMLSNIPETDYTAWNAATSYAKGARALETTTHDVYESLLGQSAVVSISPTSPGIVTWEDHGLINGTRVVFTNSGGALPNGLVNGTTYYVGSATASTFTVSATNGGVAINTSGGTGTHTCSAPNIAKPFTNTAYWVKVGKNNRWSMFDQSVSSQTSNPSLITVALAPGVRIDSVVGLNVAGATAVRVTMQDSVDGMIYDKTKSMINNGAVTDWRKYLYEPIIEFTDFMFDDLPITYSNAVTSVAIIGATPAVGGIVLGLSKDLGMTVEGTKVGIVDYGVKTKDAFGNYTIMSRGYSKRGDFSVMVPIAQADYVQNLLTAYRSVPVVYVGSNNSSAEFQSTVIYGFYKDFSIDITYPPYAACQLQVEGLT